MEVVELSDRTSHENPVEKPDPNPISTEKRSVSLFGLFAHADAVDCVLMLLGSLGACIHGAAMPVFFVLFGDIINSLGSLYLQPQKLASEISKVLCRALYFFIFSTYLFSNFQC